MSKIIAIVKLEDSRFGGGPGTIQEVTDEEILVVRKRLEDRDGCLPGNLRLWRASINGKPGDRVQL